MKITFYSKVSKMQRRKKKLSFVSNNFSATLVIKCNWKYHGLTPEMFIIVCKIDATLHSCFHVFRFLWFYVFMFACFYGSDL